MKNIKYTLFIFILITICSCNKQPTLPYFGNKTVVDGDTVYHAIQNFTFTNQLGNTITQVNFKNKIYVANFMFTTCKSICPIMTNQLLQVQKAYLNDTTVLLLSHSVDPKNDSIRALQNYAAMYQINHNKWHLVTGNKQDIYKTAKIDYLVTAKEDVTITEQFLHSEFLILVDTKKHIRGYYDGTDSMSVVKLIKDIKILLKEK